MPIVFFLEDLKSQSALRYHPWPGASRSMQDSALLGLWLSTSKLDRWDNSRAKKAETSRFLKSTRRKCDRVKVINLAISTFQYSEIYDTSS